MPRHKKTEGDETPKSERQLFSGDVKWSSTNAVGGLAIGGVITIPLEHPVTEEGVYRHVIANQPNASQIDFACEAVEKDG